MKPSQIKNMKDGDKIKLARALPAFTKGRKYRVQVKGGTVYVVDDVGERYTLNRRLSLEQYFLG